ncbi:tRNA (adenosine(37)-N6)-dimethylallyltransferase MiaA [Pannonibacter phragmitetus]|uniref:tRNA (adenosine(37)-N6)-dimethylallyltransferase MiaA n=1 Tax=Pannonibacter phragmitetus TaxID=121719 RepID=UPI000F0195DB|nr:tRNA (adenosine(37)-N6)-dimethylallyltransferase MiaA [Pannonibacter phragmitetus]
MAGTAKTAILIAGPTASGKSALAIELAQAANGVVINADSMQLYRELRLVTARPSAEDEALVPHRLYGCLPASEAFSTGAYLDLVRGEIEAVRAEGKLPVLVGGTGLYFRALTQGFAEVPPIPAAIREQCRRLATEGGISAVRSELAPLDAEAAERLMDLQRLTRALEVALGTGRTLADWQAEAHGAPLLGPEGLVKVVLAPPRPWLHARIALRAEMMLAPEGLAEVEALLALGLPDTLPAMRAIGIAEIGALLRGDCSREEAHFALTVATRRYAKRQETFFRGQLADWPRKDPQAQDQALLAREILNDF